MRTIYKEGDVFNRLTIMSLSHIDCRNRKHFNVKCSCGVVKIVQGSLMSSGNTKSCGCFNREKQKHKRISENHSEVTAIMLGYKRHALARKIKWELNREEIIPIILSNCFYCGIEPNNVKKTKNSIGEGLRYSGIDRVDSGKDYNIKNIVSCCRICNYAKSNLSIKEFQEWAIRIGSMANQWSEYVIKQKSI